MNDTVQSGDGAGDGGAGDRGVDQVTAEPSPGAAVDEGAGERVPAGPPVTPATAAARPGTPVLAGTARAIALLKAATIGTTLAVLVNVGIYLAARSAGADFVVEYPDLSTMVVGPAQVVSETVVALLCSTLLLWPMTYLRAGLRVWLVLALLVGFGSLLLPITRAQHAGTGGALVAMHLVTLAAALAFPARAARAVGAA